MPLKREYFQEEIVSPITSLETAIKVLDHADFHKKVDNCMAKYPEIIPLIEKHAKRRNPDAQYWLGFMYLSGKGKKRIISSGINWLKKSSDNGNPDAAQLIGFLYFCGDAVPMCIETALYWYKVSFENGSKTVVPDYIRAYSLYYKIKKASA